MGWHQPLSPLQKLVLLALAEAADENGVSSPSISVLAIQCQLSSRTVQRVINSLLNADLLQRDRRQREDGSSISNQYQLKVQGDDPWSGAPISQVRGECPPSEMGGHIEATLRTAITGSPNPSRQLCASASNENTPGNELSSSKAPNGGAGDSEAPAQQQSDINVLLQQFLVRLAAAIEQGNIQAMLLDFLRGFVEQAPVGSFMTESRSLNQSGTKLRENSPVAMATNEISSAFAGDYRDATTGPLPDTVTGNDHREVQPTPQTTSSKVTSTTNSNEPPAANLTDGTLRRRPLFPELARVIG